MTDRADLEITYRSPAELKPYAKNPRTHSQTQVDQIAASMKEYGFTNPILIDENMGLIAGHGRLQAATKIGLEKIPTIMLVGLSAAQRRALVIADNKLALNAGWDTDILKLELLELKESGFNMDLTGFGMSELRGIFEPPADHAGILAAQFGVPPFTVLNAREGWWQERKEAWLSLGIQSELGRGENLLKMSDTMLEPDPEKRAAMQAARQEKTTVVPGNGWGNGGPARRDPAFYAKKRAWEKDNGREISTKEFRQKHWDGAA